MNIWRVIPIIVFLSVSMQVKADYYIPYLDKSIDLISGGIHCSGWEGNSYKDFYIYAGLSTINVNGDICHTSVPNEPTRCDLAQNNLADFFSETGNCLYWRAQPPSMSAEFMCKGSRSQLIRVYIDLCGLMHEIGVD